MKVKIIKTNYLSIPIGTVLEVSAAPNDQPSYRVTPQELLSHGIHFIADDDFVYYLNDYETELVKE